MAYTRVQKIGFRLLVVLGVVLLAGCSRSVKVEPQMDPKNLHQFVSVVFVEGKHNADIPKQLTDSMHKEIEGATAAADQFAKEGIEARKKRGDRNLQKMVVEWRVLKFDPGNYWMRRFVPFYRGKGSIEVEAKYMNSSKQVLGKINTVSRVDPKPSEWLTYQGVGSMTWQPLITYFTDNYYKEY